jgi:hypothetical protein
MKNKKLYFSVILPSLLSMLLVTITSVSRAQDDSAHQHLEAGWRKATDLLDGILSPAQHSEMNVLAYSSAVAGLCDGVSLDPDKFSKGMMTLEHEDKANMSVEEKEYFESHLTFSYGVAVGLYLAEGAMDQAGFCAAALAQRDDPETEHHYWK